MKPIQNLVFSPTILTHLISLLAFAMRRRIERRCGADEDVVVKMNAENMRLIFMSARIYSDL